MKASGICHFLRRHTSPLVFAPSQGGSPFLFNQKLASLFETNFAVSFHRAMWEGGSEERSSRLATSSVESLPPLVPTRYSPVTAVTLSEEESHRLEELAVELNLDSGDFFLSITCDAGRYPVQARAL
jgi:hypothetical protein